MGYSCKTSAFIEFSSYEKNNRHSWRINNSSKTFLNQLESMGFRKLYRKLYLIYFTTRVSDTSDTSATRTARVKILDNDTSERVFSHPCTSYMANGRLQGEKQFILRTTLWKCLVPVTKCIWKAHQKNGTL